MDATPLLIGIAIGLAVAVPLGPVNFLVIRNALRGGFGAGVLTGLGPLLGDGLFAAVAAFGLREIQGFVATHAFTFQLIGGLIMTAIGLKIALTVIDDNYLRIDSATILKTGRRIVFGFAMTVANPAALAATFAMFAATSGFLRLTDEPARALAAIAGVMLGSLAWWLAVSWGVSHMRARLTVGLLAPINRWSGILIAGFGFALLLGAAGL